MSNRILYITSSLPSLTSTFIYREIEVLQKAGHDISTVSMGRPLKSQISHEALRYYESTLYLDQVNLTRKILSQFCVFFFRPRKWCNLFWLALREKEIISFRDRLRILYHFLEAGYLYTRFKDNSLHHIHAHFLSGPTSIALFLSRYLNVPYSFTMHASNIFIDHLMLKTKLQMCKKAVTISDYNKKYLLSKYGDEFAGKIDVIHCGISLQTFQPVETEKTMLPVILAVGQLLERKGMRYLVDACRLLKRKGMEFQCHIVGGGKELKLLTEMIDEYELSEFVILLGRQPQERVKKLLQEASIFVLPSIVTEFGGREGIPVALMEAMAMQLPVVSTRTAGIPELIESGKEGLLVVQKNPEELASALEFLLKNSEARIEMGRQGREKVAQQFNIDHVPSLFQDIFN